MALDTRDRRSAAILIGCPFRCQWPLPDHAIGTVGDLLHLADMGRVADSDATDLPAALLIRGSVQARLAVSGGVLCRAGIDGDAVTLDQ